MKIVKYLLVALAGVVVLAGGVVAYIAATFDPNSYKPQVIQLVKDKKQRTLKLDGDIKLSFWPSIGADLGKAALSEFKSEAEFASIERARVALKLLPLLSKKVIVDRIEVSGMRATLIKHKDGKLNIDDLLSKEEKKDQEAVEFDIDHIKIEKSAVTYRDDQARARYALSNVNLTTGRIAPNVPGNINLAMTVQGDKPKLNLGVALKTRLTFDLDKQEYALEGLALEAKGQAAELNNLNAKASGGVTAKLKTGEFTTNNLTAAFTGVSGKDNLDIKFDAPKLVVTQNKASGDKVSIAAKISNAQGATVANVVLPGIEGSAQAFKAAGMTLDWDMKQGALAVKGRITSPLSGNFQTQQINLPQLVLNLTATGPNIPGGSLSGQLAGNAAIHGAKQQGETRLAGKIADSTIKAQIGVNGFAPPGFNFDIDIDQLDLDKYAPKNVGAFAPAAGKGGGADKPIDLSGLRTLRASGRIHIGSLRASGIKANNVRAEIKAGGGQVTVAPLTANLYDGAMNGMMSINAAPAAPQFTIKHSLTGVAIGPLLRDLANKDQLEGRGTVTVDVRTQGASVAALKRALGGNAAVNLRDGAVKGIDLAGTIREARATLGSLTGKQTRQADKNKKTEFSELSGSFAIQNGVAHNRDLTLKSPLIRVGGEGDINIGEDTLNYLVKASIVGTLSGQDGRGMNELRGITVPVRATGPLAGPSFALDFNSLITDSVKQKAEDLVKNKIEEQLFGKKPAQKGAPAQESSAKGAPTTRDVGQEVLKGIFGR